MISYWVAHALAQKITETIKSLKICYLFNSNRRPIHFKIIRRRIEAAHQQKVSRYESRDY